MATRNFLTTLLAAMPILAFADGSPPSIPDSPAGNALTEWVTAFNNGDRQTFDAFRSARAPWLPLDGQMQLRERTGGYDLLSISESDKWWIVFRAKERSSSAEIVGKLIVRSYDPDRITLLSLDRADESSTKIAIDETDQSRLIGRAAKLINDFYVFPDVAGTVSAKLRAQHRRGAYRNISDAEIFAVRLTDDLVALSGDRHIGVDFFAQAMPDEPPLRPRPNPNLLAKRNCGFERADHYPPNTGYLKLNEFAEVEHCAATAMAAMNFLLDSDALIIDLRDNRGGSPHMAALVSSYLFEERTHLDNMYDRGQNTTEQLWTIPYLHAKGFSKKAIFILTSARTFSAAELFSYDLKALKRATLIGETTGGGAHAMAPHRLSDHLFIRVPFGRFINPVTKTDWEGTGVEPDVKVSATEALDVARTLAAEELNENQRSPAGSH